ncbi:MAG: hypothetical protein ACLFQK_08555, partial [Fibrobacterota bacterium]
GVPLKNRFFSVEKTRPPDITEVRSGPDNDKLMDTLYANMTSIYFTLDLKSDGSYSFLMTAGVNKGLAELMYSGIPVSFFIENYDVETTFSGNTAVLSSDSLDSDFKVVFSGTVPDNVKYRYQYEGEYSVNYNIEPGSQLDCEHYNESDPVFSAFFRICIAPEIILNSNGFCNMFLTYLYSNRKINQKKLS